MGLFRTAATDFRTGEFFPFIGRSKSFKILKCLSGQGNVGSTNHAAKVQEHFFIHLILGEQFRVVAKIPKEPIQFPGGSLGAIDPAGEGSPLERLGFENDETCLDRGECER